MPAEYKMVWRQWSDGAKIAEVTDYWRLKYLKKIGSPGPFEFELSGNHPRLPLIHDKMMVEIHRRNPDVGLDWYMDFAGVYRDAEYFYNDHDVFVGRGQDDIVLLEWRDIIYQAGLANRTTFTGQDGETIMRTLVNFNAGPSATVVNSRWKDGAITGVSLGAAVGGSSIVPVWNCHGKNLLSELRLLSEVAGGDFDLVKTGAKTWQFRFYLGQLGTDRRVNLHFALERGNISNPRYKVIRSSEKTAVIAAGQGEGAARDKVVVYGPSWSADNDIEKFYDGRNEKTTSGLQSKGNAQLEVLKAKEPFSFQVLQTQTSYYGLHYYLGDLATAAYGPFSGDIKISAVNVEHAKDGSEDIRVETEII